MSPFAPLPSNALPVIPSSHPCHECGQCCRYVAIEIEPPRSKREVSDILWHLYHQNVGAFISHEGGWYLQFNTPCEHLLPGGACRIYDQRPYVCREYEVHECERWDPPGERLFMSDALTFVRYLRCYRPRFFDRIKEAVPRELWAEPDPPRPALARVKRSARPRPSKASASRAVGRPSRPPAGGTPAPLGRRRRDARPTGRSRAGRRRARNGRGRS